MTRLRALLLGLAQSGSRFTIELRTSDCPRANYCRRQHGRINRLWNVRLESGGQDAGAIFVAGVPGKRHGRKKASLLRLSLTESRDQRVAVIIGQADIAYQCIRVRCVERLECFFNRRGRGDDCSGPFEKDRQELTTVGIILDNEDAQTVQLLKVLRGHSGCAKVFLRGHGNNSRETDGES